MRVRARRNLTYNHTFYPEGFVFDLAKDSDYKAYRDGFRKEKITDEKTGLVTWKDTTELLVQGAMIPVDADTPLGMMIEQEEEFSSGLQGKKVFNSSAEVFQAKEADDKKKLEAKMAKRPQVQTVPETQSPELAASLGAPPATQPEAQVPTGPKPGRKKKMAEV